MSENNPVMAPSGDGGIQAQSAGTLRVVSSVRSMKTYVVSDSELRSIALANGLASLFFSFMTGLWGYAFSLSTEFMFVDRPNTAATMWNNAVHPICVYGGIVFAVCGIAMLAWRHFAIDLIKRESSPEERERKNIFNRLYEAVWPA